MNDLSGTFTPSQVRGPYTDFIKSLDEYRDKILDESQITLVLNLFRDSGNTSFYSGIIEEDLTSMTENIESLNQKIQLAIANVINKNNSNLWVY